MRASQLLYTVRSERQLMERLDFDLLPLFVGLGIDDQSGTPALEERERLFNTEIAQGCGPARAGTASLHGGRDAVEGVGIDEELPSQGRQRQSGAGERDFRGEKRSNETHASTTDPDARLYRKGKGRESVLCYMGHAFMENRNGLAVGAPDLATGGRARSCAGSGTDAGRVAAASLGRGQGV